MKYSSTLLLRAAVITLGLIVLALCIFALPVGIREDNVGYRPILLGMYLTTIPYFLALHEAMKLLRYIDDNTAFSDLSVLALKRIKYCALVISGLYAAGMPYIYLVAEKDDAPGVILIGLVFTFAPVVIATFAALLQRLLQNAIDIKTENDLTV